MIRQRVAGRAVARGIVCALRLMAGETYHARGGERGNRRIGVAPRASLVRGAIVAGAGRGVAGRAVGGRVVVRGMAVGALRRDGSITTLTVTAGAGQRAMPLMGEGNGPGDRLATRRDDERHGHRALVDRQLRVALHARGTLLRAVVTGVAAGGATELEST